MKRKLAPFIAGMVAILAIGIVAAAWLTRSASHELDRISSLHRMDATRRHVLDSFWNVYKVIVDADRMRGQDINAIIESVGQIENSTNACGECHSADMVVTKVKALDESMHRFQESLSFFITTSANSQRMDRLALQSIRHGSEVLVKVEELSNLSGQQMQRSVNSMITRLRYASWVFYATLTLIAAIGVALAVMLVRSITGPVNELIDSTRMLADGKFGHRVEFAEDDEFGLLATNFNRMSEELEKSYRELGESNRKLRIEVGEHEKAEKERQRLFEELIQARKMEAVGTLAGGIAHEFNNLLQSIQVSAEFMSLSTPADNKHKKHIGVILNSSSRGAELTRRLLTFSRNVESEMRPLNLAESVHQLSTALKEEIPPGMAFNVENAGRAVWIRGDQAAIDQIVFNLVLNARDALAEGGRIALRLKTCAVGELPAGTGLDGGEHFAVIEVCDSGHGMDEATRQKIFEPFFTTKTVGAGTGLGLAITYGVVKSHGGHIACRSAPGEGTCFTIWFPAINSLAS